MIGASTSWRASTAPGCGSHQANFEPRPTTTTRTKGMTYFQRLAADAEAARQARLERLKAEAKAAEEAGALGLKKGEGD